MRFLLFSLPLLAPFFFNAIALTILRQIRRNGLLRRGLRYELMLLVQEMGMGSLLHGTDPCWRI